MSLFKDATTRLWRRTPPWLLLPVILTASLVLASNATSTLDRGGRGTLPGDAQLCPSGGCEPPPEEYCDLEVCDGVDNDCDGLVDEGLVRTYYRDADGDGYGTSSNSTHACGRPTGYVTDATDCNDSNAAVKPGAVKTCGVGECFTSVQACLNGVEQTCGPRPPSWEACDKRDNDCNGQVDDLPPLQCGQGICARTVPACANLCSQEVVQEGKPPVTTCEWGANTCIPGTSTAEVCNGADDNCNGTVDDGVLLTFYRDGDGDGYGAGSALGNGCSVPAGRSSSNQDCNDSNAAVNPAAVKTCGIGECAASVPACANGTEQSCTPRPPSWEACDRLDNDCNGTVDDPPPLRCGVGACVRTAPVCGTHCEEEVVEDGKPPVTFCEWGEFGTCTPGLPIAEVCNNGIDENCNGTADDSTDPKALLTFYADRDNDGAGISWEPRRACQRPPATSVSAGDCDDTLASVNPGAAEICDGVDNNCSGVPDESNVCRQASCP